MADALRANLEKTDTSSDAIQTVTRLLNNPYQSEIAKPFQQLRILRPVFRYRQLMIAKGISNYGVMNVTFEHDPQTGYLDTSCDTINAIMAAPTIAAPTANTAYVPGYPLLMLKRVQVTVGGSQAICSLHPQSMYMLGCLTDQSTRDRLFSMWHIGDDLATRHAAVGAQTIVNVPMFNVMPFHNINNWLRTRGMSGKASYLIDTEDPQRLISLDTGTFTSAVLSGFNIHASYPMLTQEEDKEQYHSPVQDMYLDCATSEFSTTAAAGDTIMTHDMTINTNTTGFMFMITNEVAPGGDYAPFTGVPVTRFYVTLDGQNVPNTGDESADIAMWNFHHATRGLGYAPLPPNVYGMYFPYYETPEHDINLGVLHSSKVSKATLHITMPAGLVTRRLHIVYFTKQFAYVDASKTFNLKRLM